MPIALKVLLQLAVRNIGQLTDIESSARHLAGTRTRAKISGPHLSSRATASRTERQHSSAAQARPTGTAAHTGVRVKGMVH
jgi:hypothetical protein